MILRFFSALLLLAVTQAATHAGVVILANRTNRDVTCTVTAADGPSRRVTVASNDLTVLHVANATTVSFISNNHLRTLRVEEGSAFCFMGGDTDRRLESLFTTGKASVAPPKGSAEGVVEPPKLVTIPVKVLVDDREPATQAVWEARLRKRVAAASAILEHHCRVRLEVVSVGTWESSPEAKDFAAQFSDFEHKAPSRPARLAIGFSSRPLPRDPGNPTAAAIPDPLQSHILIGEWFPLSESERLEVLLHELGHWLGAVHSPEKETVMRSLVGDGRSASKNFRIGYDPLNTLILNLIARELSGARPLRKLGMLSPRTRTQLANAYKEAVRASPEDPIAEKYMRLLEDVPPPPPPRVADPLVDGARSVVAAAVLAAEDATEQHLSGDRLTEHCIRAAATAAGKLPAAHRVSAFLLGLAVALDTSDLLRKAAPTRGLWGRVEYEDERAERLKELGEPTLYGRHRLVRHFVTAAALTSIGGARAAESGGIVRELFESEANGNFSFAELAADLSGAVFARSLMEDPGRLKAVAKSFTAANYLLTPTGLEEDLTRDEFARRYGSMSDERFRQRESEIRRSIAGLSAYKASTAR